MGEGNTGKGDWEGVVEGNGETGAGVGNGGGNGAEELSTGEREGELGIGNGGGNGGGNEGEEDGANQGLSSRDKDEASPAFNLWLGNCRSTCPSPSPNIGITESLGGLLSTSAASPELQSGLKSQVE